MYPQVFLKKDNAIYILKGHPWVFAPAIEKMPPINEGEICEIYSNEKFIGLGIWSGRVDIAIRILSREKTTIDATFFEKKFLSLKAERERFVHDTNAYRIVFGESDGLPGLVVDKYNDVMAIQFHNMGMHRMKNDIIKALVKVFSPKCIYDKSSDSMEKKEGFLAEKNCIYGKNDEEDVEILENGFRFLVNIPKGQKTGFFLDQRDNRKSVVRFVKGLKVLNCFAYTGGFSVYAASVAKHVTTIDISQGAIDYARKNFEANGFNPKKHTFLATDAFEYMKNLQTGQFDCIIIDPPSLARKKTQVPNAIKAYTSLNTAALKSLPDGGILISSSCTTHIDEATFIQILRKSAEHARCSLKVLHSALQPPDHPYNLNFPEGRYLKFFVLLKNPG